jgi:hypothetical protein
VTWHDNKVVVIVVVNRFVRSKYRWNQEDVLYRYVKSAGGCEALNNRKLALLTLSGAAVTK